MKQFSLVKPSLQTKFNIDFDWWKNNDRDWRVYLKNFLCEKHQKVFASYSGNEIMDWIDPLTAEVKPVDALLHTLITHCTKEDTFSIESGPIVESVFKLFLVNENKPLTCNEIALLLNKPENLILRTFSSSRVYKGIRPVVTEN